MAMQGFFYTEDVPQLKTQQKKDVKLLHGKEACQACGLYKKEYLNNPKIQPYGKFKKKIMLWGYYPGRTEDERNKPFHPDAKAGGVLHRACHRVGISPYRDCIIVNAVDCRKATADGKANRDPTKDELRFCYSRKERALQKYKPKVILLLGKEAKDSFYGHHKDRKTYNALSIASLRGKIIPDPSTGAWICHSYHPSFLARNTDMMDIFQLDMETFASILPFGRPKFENHVKEIRVLNKFHKIVQLLKYIKRIEPHIVFDYETSSYRYHEDPDLHELYMLSISVNGVVYSFPWNKTRISTGKKWWRKDQLAKLHKLWKSIILNKDIPKTAHNLKHEHKATRYFFGAETKGWFHDTMIGAHLLDESKKTKGLKFQVYFNFGVYDYGLPTNVMGAGLGEKNKFDSVPTKEGAIYCGLDSRFTDKLMRRQRKQLKEQKLIKPYNLFHTGVQALADIENKGIHMDMDLAVEMSNEMETEMGELKESIFSSPEAKRFEKVMGRPIKYEKKLADGDLRHLLFDILKFKPLRKTKTTYSVDAAVLEHYADKCSLIDYELKYRKTSKARGYLQNFIAMAVNGFVYPNYNLHTTRSHRSSSTDPSFHTLPKRDPFMKKIRKVFTSRFGKLGRIGEVDYGAMEVRIIACVTKDRALIDFIVSGTDPHSYWAERIFKVKEKDVPKKVFYKLRDIAKNMWVFPLFYGSYWKSILRTIKMPKWFKRKSQWALHLKKCEDLFWGMFSGVRAWQDRVVKAYRKNGFIRDFSWGFKRRGYLVRNKLYSFPIQGPAYHCLQWIINTLWEESYYYFESLLCGEIHDALYWDFINFADFKRVKKKVTWLMTDKIREANPWIIVPLITEWSIGKNWLEMAEIKERKRIFI